MADCGNDDNGGGEMAARVEFRDAVQLEALTIAWMVAEAGVSIGAGLIAGSLLLMAFGVDSIIELISACVLFYRLWQECRALHIDEDRFEALEGRAGRIAGYLLYALCAYVVAQAVWGLTHRHRAEISAWGIAVAVIAAFGMPLLAKAKICIADRIRSKALRADAMKTLTCGYLSWVLLAGLAANALFHWWWLDSVASLLIVPLLLREAREAVTGECDCDDTEATARLGVTACDQSMCRINTSCHEKQKGKEF